MIKLIICIGLLYLHIAVALCVSAPQSCLCKVAEDWGTDQWRRQVFASKGSKIVVTE